MGPRSGFAHPAPDRIRVPFSFSHSIKQGNIGQAKVYGDDPFRLSGKRHDLGAGDRAEHQNQRDQASAGRYRIGKQRDGDISAG